MSNLYLSQAKFSCVCLSRAAIAAVIRAMFSWELVWKFPSQNRCSLEKKRSLLCLRILFCRLNEYSLHVRQRWIIVFKRFCGTLVNLLRITDWGGLIALQWFKMIDYVIKNFFAGRTKRLSKSRVGQARFKKYFTFNFLNSLIPIL